MKSSLNHLGIKYFQNQIGNAVRSMSHVTSTSKNIASVELDEETGVQSRLKLLRQKKIPAFSEFLVDNFRRQHNYLRISVTERCNLRCHYCMPEEGVPLTPTSKLLSNDEVIRVAKLFISEGVDKIRFTGGEPLLRKDLPSIISKVSETGKLKAIGITTNGILVPRLLTNLVNSGVTHINISLDSLNPKLFEKISRRPSIVWFKVWKGIEMALENEKLQELKLNVVVMKGTNENEIPDFVQLTKDWNIDVRFIEYMPFTGNKWDHSKMVSYQEMLKIIRERFPEIVKMNDSVNHTAKGYRIPGYKGQFGFITSMSEHFCGGCNRLRITADGNLKVCLFGNSEVSLRDAMRKGVSDEDLLNLIGQGVKRKHAKHAGMMNLSKMENRPMILIASMNAKLRNFSIDKYFNKLHPIRLRYIFANSNVQLLNYFNLNKYSSIRQYSTFGNDDNKLSHVDADGKVKMVDVTNKRITIREAIAHGTVQLNEMTFKAVLENKMKKGDVIATSQIAGILGGKQTSNLIPLCHPLPLTKLDVKLNLDTDNNCIHIESYAKTSSNTGVEMEALTSVSIAALTIYDMCKAMDKGIVIKDIRLIRKTGGKTDFQSENFHSFTR